MDKGRVKMDSDPHAVLSSYLSAEQYAAATELMNIRAVPVAL
jgi:hypothetical protein